MRAFALVFGLIYLAAGIAGFIPGLVEPASGGHGNLIVQDGHGMLLGLFPVNTLHNIVHVLIGVWGLAAVAGYGSSMVFFRSLAVFYGVLGVMGLFAETNTLFGLVPLHGNDVWLHLGTAFFAAIIGWGFPAAHSTATYELDVEERKRAA